MNCPKVVLGRNNESRVLAEALPSVRSVPCTIHIPKSIRKC